MPSHFPVRWGTLQNLTFYQFVSVVWVVRTLIGGGDTQIWTIIKFVKTLHSRGGGDTKILLLRRTSYLVNILLPNILEGGEPTSPASDNVWFLPRPRVLLWSTVQNKPVKPSILYSILHRLTWNRKALLSAGNADGIVKFCNNTRYIKKTDIFTEKF